MNTTQTTLPGPPPPDSKHITSLYPKPHPPTLWHRFLSVIAGAHYLPRWPQPRVARLHPVSCLRLQPAGTRQPRVREGGARAQEQLRVFRARLLKQQLQWGELLPEVLRPGLQGVQEQPGTSARRGVAAAATHGDSSSPAAAAARAATARAAVAPKQQQDPQ